MYPKVISICWQECSITDVRAKCIYLYFTLTLLFLKNNDVVPKKVLNNKTQNI